MTERKDGRRDGGIREMALIAFVSSGREGVMTLCPPSVRWQCLSPPWVSSQSTWRLCLRASTFLFKYADRIWAINSGLPKTQNV